MSGQLRLVTAVTPADKAAIRKRDREADKTLTELHGVRVGQVYVITDSRYVNNGYAIEREVIGLRNPDGGKPAALLTGFVATWVKIDTYKGTVNGYKRVSIV